MVRVGAKRPGNCLVPYVVCARPAFFGRAGKGPSVKLPCPPSADRWEREVVAVAPPQSGGERQAIDAVARNGCAGVPRMRRIPNLFSGATWPQVGCASTSA